MPADTIPLYFTFGNHMHWVDMQWLWGYGVLPGSVADMLTLARETGARGNVNFDGIGYEKMAAECPEALASLRAAVAEGIVEPVGCSYGQPYGLFHGGESNVRQLTFGVRAVQRLLGTRPATFWEEEFYFFPQLPQLLAGTGFSGASLFFQWTWHTPEIPKEAASLILWEGIDGTRLPTLPRGDLNLHQWPEDFVGVLDRIAAAKHETAPAIVQWLELMPTRDWMCRSELLLPRLKELFSDARFDVRPRTAAALIRELRADAPTEKIPVRRYTMDDVWHGMTAGKNADRHPRTSAQIEYDILEAETLSTLAGFLGRPYPSWDLYPTWELEEAWRELLSAQHHDNHECEGLCGFVGYHSMDRAASLVREVRERTTDSILRKLNAAKGKDLAVFNPLGWPAPVVLSDPESGTSAVIENVPPMGYAVLSDDPGSFADTPVVDFRRDKHTARLTRGEFSVSIDTRAGTIVQIGSEALGEFALDATRPLLAFEMTRDKRTERFSTVETKIVGEDDEESDPRAVIRRTNAAEDDLSAFVDLAPDAPAVDITIEAMALKRPDGGMHAGLRIPFTPAFKIGQILADTPYAIEPVRADKSWRRKYPTGDWMTSPQWFEDIKNPFTSLSLVDLLSAKGDGRGLLILHESIVQWFRDDRGVWALLSAYDPWDEDTHSVAGASMRLRILPHGPMTNAERIKAAHQFLAGPAESFDASAGDLPPAFGLASVEGADNVLLHACFRESPKSGEHLPNWAGRRMAAETAGACDHPLVYRLVEWDGKPARVTLKLPGPVALAAKTNLMGEAETRDWLKVEPARPPTWAKGSTLRGQPLAWSQVTFDMRPHEVATIMADAVLARKQWRDLDAKREVWATVHKK